MNFYPIFKKELKSYFGSLTAYILITVFLVISAYFYYTDIIFFVLWGGVSLPEGLWQYFFHDVRLIMLLMIPLLTMRLFSEEQKSGTMELLVTFPLRDGEILLGKFAACLTIFTVMLGLTFTYPLLLDIFYRVDLGPVISGYLGLLLLGSSFISIGILISSFTENQIVSAFVTFVVLLLFWFVSWNEGAGGENLMKILLRISLFDHFYSFSRGVIETKDVIYHFTFTLFFLFLTLRSLESRKWRGVK